MNPASASLVHVHCGDCSAELARRSGLPGAVLVWSELLHEGPLPAEPFDSGVWRAPRASHLSLSTGGAIDAERCLKRLAEQDAALEAALGDGAQFVFWFDACLYDQTILARHLKWLASKEVPPGRAWLVCAGEFPGVDNFTGLGQLSPGNLASLYEGRIEVGAEEIEAGAKAWDALASPSPEGMLRLALEGIPELPFMAEALMRHLRQYPSWQNGLPLLEQEALAALAEGRGQSPVSVFKRVSEMERRPYFGDTTLWRRLNGLASCPNPPLKIDGPSPLLPLWHEPKPPPISSWRLSLTETGKRLLECALDHVALNGASFALGGVRFEGRSCLRFDHEALEFKVK